MRKALTALLLLLSLKAGAQDWLWTGFSPLRDTVSLYIVGDIMSHGPMVKSAIRTCPPDYSTFFKYLEGRIGEADIAIGNLEFPLAGRPYTGYPAFSGPPEYVEYLEKIGFDVLLTANNHILDKGSAGLKSTLRKLNDCHLLYTGISASADDDAARYPLLVGCKGIRIAFLNFTYGTNMGASAPWPKVNYMNRKDISRALDRCREADIVIAFPHWGIEYAQKHSPDQEEMAAWLVSEGVDLIIGTHPHVIQDRQDVEGVPVFYSIGNAISNQRDLPARLELGLRVRIATSYLEAPHLVDVTCEYLWCTKPGMVEESYSTLPVVDFLDHRERWKVKEDYDDMVRTLEMVKATAPLDGVLSSE